MRLYGLAAGLLALPLFFGHAHTAHAATACAAAWNSSTVYSTAGTEVSQYNVNYTNSYWTQGNSPETNNTTQDPNGPNSVWVVAGSCGSCDVAPTAPTSLTDVATDDTQTDLIWQTPSLPVNCKITSYTVYQNGKKVGTTTWNNLGLNNLTASTKYSFSVTAADSAGGSVKSKALSFETLASGQGRGPTPWYAPYSDMGQQLAESMPALVKNGTIQHFTLAFLIAPTEAANECQAYWSGTNSIYDDKPYSNSESILEIVNGVRKNGGDVIISFGGANGTTVAEACTPPPPKTGTLTQKQLQAAAEKIQKIYQAVIERYKVTYLDFDIETGGSLGNQGSLEARNMALIAIRKANPGIVISFTLPVFPTGLTASAPSSLNVITTAAADGFDPDVVNVMTMDYGSGVDAGGTDMGLYAILAANNTALQIKAAKLTSRVSITPDLGINDDASEIFTFADTATVVKWATSNPDVARLSNWSINRDNNSAKNDCKVGTGTYDCSGVQQTPFEFAKDFKPFNQ
jgi:chitodextrinase